MDTTHFTPDFIESLATALASKINAPVQASAEPPVERYLSIKELCKVVGITRQQVHKLTCKGIFKAYNKGTRMVRYKLSEVEAAMAAL